MFHTRSLVIMGSTMITESHGTRGNIPDGRPRALPAPDGWTMATDQTQYHRPCRPSLGTRAKPTPPKKCWQAAGHTIAVVQTESAVGELSQAQERLAVRLLLSRY